MALTPETRPINRNPSLAPAGDYPPQVGVYYDQSGTPQRAYMLAPPPPGVVTASGGVSAPGSFSAVVKSDTTLLPTGTQALWVGGAGNVAVQGLDGATATFTAVPAGTLIRGQFTRVMSTGTTATLIVAMV